MASENPRLSWQTNARRLLLRPLDTFLRGTTDGGYAAYKLAEREHAATIPDRLTLDDVKAVFYDAGFSQAYLAALKRDWHGNAEAASLVYRDGWLADDQLHVHLFVHDGHVLVAAHKEKSWVTHPRDHYFGRGYDIDAGVAAAQDILDQHGLPNRKPDS